MLDAAYLFDIVMIAPPFELSAELVERVAQYRFQARGWSRPRGGKVELRVVRGGSG